MSHMNSGRGWLARRLAGGAALIGCALVAIGAGAAASAHEAEPVVPIMIERMGSFQVGGRVMGEEGSTLHCDNGYVEYQIPVVPRKTAIFLWHSSSARVWQGNWAGGEGYQSMLLRRGYPVYLWDGPRVGRGNWGCESYTYEPAQGQDQRNFTAWRFGPAPGEWFEGVQFPTGDAEAYAQAMSARYQEFDIAKNAHLEASAGAKALDRIGPSVVLTNSAGDWRAMLAALETDNIKGLVAYEPAAFVFPEGEGPDGPETGFGPTHVPLEQFKRLTRFPIQIVWGDFVDRSADWTRYLRLSRQFVEIVNRHGGQAEVLVLPEHGVRGNTHIPFADLNNAELMTLLEAFLAKHGLDER